MTTTYKDLTPGEALDALIRGEKVERLSLCGTWVTNTSRDIFRAEDEKDYAYRLVIESKPETVEDIISAWPIITTLESRVEWLRRLVAAVKNDIKREILGELKR